MDTDYEYPIYGWTATTTTSNHNETLDLLYHRWKTGREAQEIFLEQNTVFLEAEGGQPSQVQVAGILITRDDAQVAASWDSLWDEEENDDKSEEEEDSNSFYYCLSPDKVCSMESITSTGETVVMGFSFVFEDIGRELPLAGGQIIEAQDLTMSSRSSHTSPGPSSPSPVNNPEHANKGNGNGKEKSPEHSGLRPIIAPRPSDHPILSDPSKHGTRWEPITVMLGNWERQFTVLKPYSDYTDVPSPIMLPGSPPQRLPKPSLSGFYKIPTTRDPFEAEDIAWRSRSKEEHSPPAPPLKLPERIDTLRHHHRRNNSDVSSLNLGDPYQPLDDDEPLAGQSEQNQRGLAGGSNLSFTLSLSRRVGTPASGVSIVAPVHESWTSSVTLNVGHPSGLRARRGREGAARLSLLIPGRNYEEEECPQSKPISPTSTTSSLGAVFQLDEEQCKYLPVNCHIFHF